MYHQYFISREGAGGTRSYENALALIKAGHSVTMVCGDGHSGLEKKYKFGRRRGIVDGIEVIQFNIKYSNHLSLLRRSLSFLKFIIQSLGIVFTEKYDVIFATSTPLTIGIPGIFAKVFRGKYFVFEVRDLWPDLPVAMGVIKNPVVIYLLKLLEYLTYKSADRLIGLSSGMVEGIIKKGIPKERVKLLPNGCDVKIFEEESSTISENSEKIFEKNFFIATFCGAHGLANGLDAVIDAAVYLNEINETEIKFLFIGDGKLKKNLIERANRENLGNCIFYSPVPRIKAMAYLMKSDIGLQILMNVPEFYNGTSPNKFYDYLAAGIPVLVNYPGEVAEIVKKNKLGFVADPGDFKSFGDSLILLKNNPELKREMKQNAKKVSKILDRNIITSEWVEWVTKN